MTETKVQYTACVPSTAAGKKIVMFHPYVNRRAVAEVVDTLTCIHPDGRLWIGEGPKVKEFERQLCDRFQFPYAVALNSGTAALRLALALAGVGPGDEVITTAQTCTATNTPILECFATPVFADIQYETGNIDPADIEHRITEKTKAVIVVHWAGYPCDLDEIWDIAHRHGIPVIEDGAHALGATYKGHHIGERGDFVMFSFQAIKQLTTGDGGLLVLRSQEEYDKARRLRWFGIDRENRIMQPGGYPFWNQTEPGFKMHMNDIAASIGLGNLEDIDGILRRRGDIAAFYDRGLRGIAGVWLFEHKQDRSSGNWLYTMHVEDRDDFVAAMAGRGIETGIVHCRNDIHGVFGGRRGDLPNLDRYEKTNVSIPLHNHLSNDDVGYVIESIRRGW